MNNNKIWLVLHFNCEEQEQIEVCSVDIFSDCINDEQAISNVEFVEALNEMEDNRQSLIKFEQDRLVSSLCDKRKRQGN